MMSHDDRGSESPLPRRLSGPELQHLVDALIDAFDYAGLRELALFKLDEDLAEIAAGSNLREAALSLVLWTSRQGRLKELIDGAIAQNPGNPGLQRFKREVWSAPQALQEPPTVEGSKHLAAGVAVSGNLRTSPSRPTGAAARNGAAAVGPANAAATTQADGRSIPELLRSTWSTLPDILKQGAALVTGIAALVTALVAAGIIGRSAPEPPTPTASILSIPTATVPQAVTPTPPPAIMRADLSDPRIEYGVTLGEGCENRGWPCEQFSEDQYSTMGLVVNFAVRMWGYAGRRSEARWTMYDAETERPIPNQKDQPGWPQGVIVPEGPDDQVRGEVWVPLPLHEGEFFVRLTLYNDLDTELDSLETETFAGAG